MYTKRNIIEIQNMTRIALCTAILCVSSYLVIPLPFTPIVFSMQTVMVNLIGLILKPKSAALTILMYLCMGMIGLPVFSGGSAGIGKLIGPTGGFYFGFFFAVIVISLFKGKKPNRIRYVMITIGLGIPIQHFFAILFMCFYNGFQIKTALFTVSIPFLVGDIIKCVMASIIAVELNRRFVNHSVTCT